MTDSGASPAWCNCYCVHCRMNDHCCHPPCGVARGHAFSVRPEPPSREVIYPPRGYCIGFFDGNTGAMIGPYHTEAEAREALGGAYITVVGQPPPPLPDNQPLPVVYMPNELELAAARGAIVGLITSVALNRVQPTVDVLDTIIQSVVRAIDWRPPTQGRIAPYQPSQDGGR